MSRIGRLPVSVPDKVKIEVKDTTINVEGPKGKLSKTFSPVIELTFEKQKVRVRPRNDTPFARAMHGTARSVIAGMVKGVTDGYAKELEIQGVGFKANLKGSTLDLALGYSHPIAYAIPAGIKVTVTDNTKLKVEGPDKQLVGAVTAEIRSFYPPEPYKGKGVRIVGEYAERVRRKEGKTVA